MRVLILLCCSCAAAFAGSWSGTLVDAKCWGFEERNVNPQDTETSVDRDRNLEVSLCAPRLKTTSFAVVPPNGVSLRLDAAGNAKAADLVRQNGRKAPLRVNVTGDLAKNTIAVASIAAAK